VKLKIQFSLEIIFLQDLENSPKEIIDRECSSSLQKLLEGHGSN
jgi:hypothetical protein